MSFEETLAALLQQIAALRAELERVTAELYAVHPWPADAELAVSPARAGELTGYTAETILAQVNAGHLRATKPAGSRESWWTTCGAGSRRRRARSRCWTTGPKRP